MKGYGIINASRIIVGGDQNLTLHRNEVWGWSTRYDSLSKFFGGLFEEGSLVDVSLYGLSRGMGAMEKSKSQRNYIDSW